MVIMSTQEGNNNDYGAYRKEDAESALRRSLESDPSRLVVQLITLVLFYVLAARAVANGLPASYLILPLVFEFVFALWLGLLMSRTVVDCPAFRTSNGIGIRPLFWTLVLSAGTLGWFAYGNDGFSMERVPGAAEQSWEGIVDTGLVWAILASAIGLLVASARDVVAWQRRSGTFLWDTNLVMSIRVLMGIPLLAFVGFLLLPLLGLFIEMESGDVIFTVNPAWLMLGTLLLLDVGIMVKGAVFHRMLKRDTASC